MSESRFMGWRYTFRETLARVNYERTLRKEPRLTLRALHQATDVSLSQLVKLNTDRATRLDTDEIERLAKAMGVSSSELLVYEPDEGEVPA
jgi:DNA-binding Xre family transcriptional regulator